MPSLSMKPVRAVLAGIIKRFPNYPSVRQRQDGGESLNDVTGYVQYEFIKEELRDLLAAADLIISRAGANAICEILALRKPNILIPLLSRCQQRRPDPECRIIPETGLQLCSSRKKRSPTRNFLDTIHQVYNDREKYQKAIWLPVIRIRRFRLLPI